MSPRLFSLPLCKEYISKYATARVIPGPGCKTRFVFVFTLVLLRRSWCLRYHLGRQFVWRLGLHLSPSIVCCNRCCAVIPLLDKLQRSRDGLMTLRISPGGS
ncbi:uncharacterized protein BO66DRAFT_236072 [Aspergillus aculeatinus CBS 121060]|uniref:Uncharacterized protein n=1 Tax=Aspergillus aculeatinus CBS 121060 TaxID=1448322 RepID=A0ACD1HIB7_9EURO|nr:hypothetical protein BO66DRAFT_236072 [Aspergillus aculeatinus CBS 121060]RAH73152.1 hypothetical protein BO66DRAFT_236072 [Aspergillus aculeatinus CBS 121060]